MEKITHNDINRYSGLFYRFVLAPEYHIIRHICLIIAMGVIAVNQSFMAFSDCLEEIGNTVFFVCFLNLIFYISACYLNLYILIPRFLFKEKYISYIIYFTICNLLLVFASYGKEYFVCRFYDLDPGLFTVGNPDYIMPLDVFAAFVSDALCIGGSTMTIMFIRRWMKDNEQVDRLEKQQLLSHIDQMKEQVNPLFLFDILHRIGELTAIDQQKASDMLMEISDLLRYQLYDCSREKVLLNTEIAFINNYLTLQKAYHTHLECTLNTCGNVTGIFLPPLLFLPFIQQAVKDIAYENDAIALHVTFELMKGSLLFSCNCMSSSILESSSLINLQKRLETLFPSKYKLGIEAADPLPHHKIYLQLSI